jgi:hypothetical protein
LPAQRGAADNAMADVSPAFLIAAEVAELLAYAGSSGESRAGKLPGARARCFPDLASATLAPCAIRPSW